MGHHERSPVDGPDSTPARSVRFGTHDDARELLEGVGAAVIQAMTGLKDSSLPARWAEPGGPVPSAEAQQRLRLGHRVWLTLVRAEGPSVALAWLVGSNPRLGGETPLTRIRQLRTAEVLGAAEAFVKDSPLRGRRGS